MGNIERKKSHKEKHIVQKRQNKHPLKGEIEPICYNEKRKNNYWRAKWKNGIADQKNDRKEAR